MQAQKGMEIKATHLKKQIDKNTNLLQDISLYIQPHEFIAIVGLTGAGKTTLMHALSGYSPATEGEVLVDDTNLYANFEAFRTSIGFVPQRDIIHDELTVFQALNYAAQLRLPPGTSPEERLQRIDEVLEELDLTEQRELQVRKLSGGQMKRVSIGVELITRPRILFLDEPTSGLDPNTETSCMNLLRDLADQGRTIIMITHSTKNIMMTDKVIFMMRGGWLGWYGPPDEALTYFAELHGEKMGSIDFDSVYALLYTSSENLQKWADQYNAHPAYQKYIAAPLGLGESKSVSPVSPSRTSLEAPKQASSFRQFLILTRRNFQILFNDRITLALMLIVAPVISAFILVLMYREMYDPLEGDSTRIMISFTLLLFMAMAIGGMTFMREFVKETDVYKRERLVNIRIFPYVMSKVAVGAILGVWQAMAWFITLYIAIKMPSGMDIAANIYISLYLATFIGILMGLTASALSPTEGATPMLLAFLIMPQVMFSGALLPITKLNVVGEAITSIMPSRFVLESIVTAGGHGKAVVEDACWQLPDAERKALTSEEKQNCTCLGENIFTKCNFPGIRHFYNPAVDETEPTPPEFASQTDPEAMRAYLEELEKYQAEYADWQARRSEAIGSAEGRIEVEYDNFGPIFDVNLLGHWAALLLTAGVFTLAIVRIQKAKDVL